MNIQNLLSKRVQRIKPSPTLAITAKAKALKAQGIDVISFGAGEPDFDTPENIKAAAIASINSGFTKYTPVAGIPELKEAIVKDLQTYFGLTYSPDEIMVSCGGKHSLYNVAQALFEEGDEVIIPAPYWVSYPDQVLLNDATPVIVNTTDETQFKITAEQLEQAITNKTKAFILNSPSNPTGAAYTEQELKSLAAVLVNHDIICISDEIYSRLIYDGTEHISMAAMGRPIKNKTIVCGGVSKVYSMTGWRMGFSAGPIELIKAMSKIQGQVTSNINSITQKACVEAYTGPQETVSEMVKAFQSRRDYMYDRIQKMDGLSCIKPQGAFYVFPNMSQLIGRKAGAKTIQTASDFADYLLEEFQVALVPGEGFGSPMNIRLSYATSMKNIESGLDRIEKAISQLG